MKQPSHLITAPTGYFEHYLLSEDLYWSYDAYVIFGQIPSVKLLPLKELISFIHPDEQEQYIFMIGEIYLRQMPFEFSTLVVAASGGLKKVMRKGAFYKDRNGLVNRVHGSIHDLTHELSEGETDAVLQVSTNSTFNYKRSVLAEIKAATNQLRLEEESVQLQKERLELEYQQIKKGDQEEHKVFQMILIAQEKERKRIAESLHNGLGQMLYAVKLSLDSLNLQAEHFNLERLNEVKVATNKLLGQAISESRRLSHELTPTILEDFGLKEAVSEICQQFGSKIQFKVEFLGIYVRLQEHIEIAVYRIVQELVLNLVKHSKATQATVRIQKIKKNVILVVRDNGKGFSLKKMNNGIGLRTILNKVKLLYGNFNLDCGNQDFCEITIVIPV
jgi:signal transduction histidine kinase